MTQFADRTGLTSGRGVRRYLWTDAFAVCNFLGLARATGDGGYRDLALRLVDQVHHELGRHRADDHRTGWISELPSDEGEAHPTRGGLRIGKPLPERAATETLDPDLEWDRDGQYFHYLTKWVHALDQVARSTGRSTFHVWARELMHTAHRAFMCGPPGGKRMMWKLSIDLSRPLVASMGQHDPLDGVVTCAELEATAFELQLVAGQSLTVAKADFAEMLDWTGLVTTDPLGLGGLLVDTCRLVQVEPANHDRIASLLGVCMMGLRQYVTDSSLRAPAYRRLGFRELGLAIGLAGVSMLQKEVWMDRLDAGGRAGIEALARYVPLRTEIESFWMLPEHRRTSTWIGHADINDVMLAASLVPDGFLALVSPEPASTAPAPFHPIALSHR